ncbi:MAG: NAD-dependent deacylase [Nonlabens sp.]
MKNFVVLSGAGISAESGINTFRDSGGLWEGHDVMEVASPQGFAHNPELVLNFYNKRRAQLKTVQPNDAHFCVAGLERNFNVQVITQNVDDLHERAGSSQVIHLHGELLKARSSKDNHSVINWKEDIHIGDQAADGSQLRPHIVWFGEEVPMMEQAIEVVEKADILLIVGTSLQVYPAAGLRNYIRPQVHTYLVDPNPAVQSGHKLTVIAKMASTGVQEVADLISNF